MIKPIFISLENSLDEALNYYENSPQTTEYINEGVHLLPNNDLPYVQTTNAPDGIELELAQSVMVCDVCGNELGDITDSFTVLNNFNDPANGLPQIVWELRNIEFDAKYQPVYLKIHTGDNVYIYSTVFYLTADEKEYTTLVYYKNRENGYMMGVGLFMYYRQPVSSLELKNYTAVSSGNMFTASATITKYLKFNTGVIDVDVAEKIRELFLCRWVYTLPETFKNELPAKSNLFDTFDSIELEADENFGQMSLNIIRNKAFTYDPNAPVIIPPIPPVDPPFINLIKVVSRDNKNVFYHFEFGNFNPTYLQYQYSFDEIEWFNNTSGTESPMLIEVIDNLNAPYSYRIYYPALDVTSNIVNLQTPGIEITNITSSQSEFIQTGNNYQIYYELLGFSAITGLSFEASWDGTNWQPLYYSSGNQNPKSVQTPSSGLQFKYFRIKYNPLGYVSNFYEFEF